MTDEARTVAVRDAGHHLSDDEVLSLMARALVSGAAASSDAGRANYQIHMTVCERCGAGEQQAGGERVAVRPEVVETAKCDCTIVPGSIGESERPRGRDAGPGSGRPRGRDAGGDPVSGRPRGRASQSVPPATRRQVVEHAKGRCAVPGCRHHAFLDVHHLKLRSEDGSHDADNLVLLCSVHHAAVHDGRMIIRGTPAEGLRFHHADGSRYGHRRPDVPKIDHHRRAFTVLCKLGFGQGQVRAALDDVGAHVGAAPDTEMLVRAALGRLREGIVSVRDEGPGYVAEPVITPFLAS